MPGLTAAGQITYVASTFQEVRLSHLAETLRVGDNKIKRHTQSVTTHHAANCLTEDESLACCCVPSGVTPPVNMLRHGITTRNQ